MTTPAMKARALIVGLVMAGLLVAYMIRSDPHGAAPPKQGQRP